MISIAKYAGIGTLAGSLFGSVLWASEQVGIVELKDPAPEAFDFDRGAYQIFGRLHQYRHRSPEANTCYIGALQNTDNLLHLVRTLRNGVPPDLDEGYIATGYAQAAKKYAMELKSHLDPKALIVATPLIDDLWDLLVRHVKNALILIEDAPVSDPVS